MAPGEERADGFAPLERYRSHAPEESHALRVDPKRLCGMVPKLARNGELPRRDAATLARGENVLARDAAISERRPQSVLEEKMVVVTSPGEPAKPTVTIRDRSLARAV
jgi:hypothetical protein